jgi:cobalt-zinc-cadmium efflux system outer membrane protein
MFHIKTIYLWLLSAVVFVASAMADEPILTLQRITDRVIERSPALKELEARMVAAGALEHQANRRPNPELETEVEDFDSLDGLDEAEYSVTLFQDIELGAKRRHRRRLGQAVTLQIATEREVLRREIRQHVAERYIDALRAHAQIQWLREEIDAVREQLRDTEVRYSNGGVSRIDLLEIRKAKVNIEVQLQRAELRRAVDLQQLASQSGVLSLSPDHLPNMMAMRTVELPSLSEFERKLEQQPEMQLKRQAVIAAQRVQQLEESRRIPDLVMGVGARYHAAAEETSWKVVAAMPLPVFDTHKDMVRAAKADVLAAEMERDEAWLQQKILLADLYSEAKADEAVLNRIVDERLVLSSEALLEMERRFDEGHVTLYDLCLMRRAHVQLQMEYTELWASYLQRLAALSAITGTDLLPLL